MGSELAGDVGQLLWVGFHGTEVPDELRDRIAGGDVGAVILFARNLVKTPEGETDTGALRSLCADLHAAAEGAGRRLLIAVDQEGGRVQRVRAPATVWPPMLRLGDAPAERGGALARQVGEALGRELRALGFDVDFAPVLDVHTNPANPVIGDRAFATEPARVAELALAFASGLEAAGILPCGKHFPGHGDTHEDSHLALPRIDHEMERLRRIELAPFARAAEAGLPMIMTAHVVFAALDSQRPATLSPRVMTELLRGELGYRGVVVSDDLDMKAIAAHWGAGDAAVQAIAAGCDALLLCADAAAQRDARDALLAAGERSVELRARIAEAAVRVRALAPAEGLRPDPAAVLAAAEHRRLADEMARGSEA